MLNNLKNNRVWNGGIELIYKKFQNSIDKDYLIEEKRYEINDIRNLKIKLQEIDYFHRLAGGKHQHIKLPQLEFTVATTNGNIESFIVGSSYIVTSDSDKEFSKHTIDFLYDSFGLMYHEYQNLINSFSRFECPCCDKKYSLTHSEYDISKILVTVIKDVDLKPCENKISIEYYKTFKENDVNNPDNYLGLKLKTFTPFEQETGIIQ